MLRQTFTKLSRPTIASSARTFSISARTMGEGDTGAPRSGLGQPDAFQKREKANEDYTIRMREKEKLQELKTKLAEQRKHLQQLENHIDELTKTQGGEQN